MQNLETHDQYINYVKAELATLNPFDAQASYDTGYGLHIVNAKLGDSCHCMDVMAHSILKIRSPNIQGEAWYTAWSEGCKVVQEYIKNIGN